ncbi:MFS transporter [Rugosimonospora africana]|uniref:Putative major facilitator superfamily protein n=1 Tax=Rugosimonospora africana TaxID=556532 RepID=A0A8J3QKA4_9ACTN|nr:MFS transporter [Rugosimonospora africana]GIH12543.1 putative major facilitator superfamily protein [Rugosimonospora africana]
MPLEQRDRRARTGAAGAYFVQGLCFAGLVTRVPTLQKSFHFTDGQLTLILLIVPVVAGVGSVLAGVLAPRIGSALVLRVAGPTVCVAMAAVGFAPGRAALYPAIALFGLALGAVDATMNMQGVAVQHRYGRSILASFHGVWSVGGILGSLANAGAGRLHLDLGPNLGIIALVGLVLALSVGPLLYRRDEAAARAVDVPADAPPPRIPWAPIVLVGLAVMLMYISDSATSNWSAKYLQDALRASNSVAPLGLAGYLLCQMLGRLVADWPVRRLGPVLPVAVGGLIGVLGMTLVAVARVPGLAIAGFAIVGFGLCVVVPQSFSAAGALDPTGSGVAIARVNLFNYVGFVVGAGLIGVVDEAVGLRWAFAVPALLCLGIIGLAPSFRVASDAAGTVRPAEAAPVS